MKFNTFEDIIEWQKAKEMTVSVKKTVDSSLRSE